ncbi:MAG: segregation/condensation protein A [Rhodothermales bacterium]|nr:segregation/condensation protein A [Rhodothermales bacterium]
MFQVRVDQFEGPLDLLLFFIQRDELDIYDIPIASIADEFLEYVRVLEQIDLDGVGDFLYMAAILINIKARVLLPSQEVDEEGDPIDPRTELVTRLLEYVRYKEAAEQLTTQLEARAQIFTRGDASSPAINAATGLEAVRQGSVFDLISALKRVLSTATDEPEHQIEGESYSIEEQQTFIVSELKIHRRQSFVQLVKRRSKAFIITTFLAVLELARNGVLEIAIMGEAEDFELIASQPIEEPADTVIVGETEKQ